MSERSPIHALLDEKIPRDVIAKRDGGNGRKLDYLEGWYVIARMNEIFGQGGWEYRTEEMKEVFTGEVNGKFVAHYIARIALIVKSLKMDGSPIIFSDYGYGDGSDKVNPGKAHELAVKEAVTDGVKRCAKNLGMSMGLALYDKTQENVDDGEPEPPAAIAGVRKAVAKASPKPPTIGIAPVPAPSPKPTEEAAPVVTPVPASAQPEAIPATPPQDRETLNKMITQMSKVIVSQRKNSVSGLKALLQEKWGAESKEALSDEQAKELYAALKGMIDV